MPKLVLPLACLLLLVAVAPASASHLVGIKVVATDVNPATRGVDVDFTVYTDGPESVRGFTTTNITLIWGDGEGTSEAEATLVSSAGPYVYRGSMSHTYEEGDVEEAGGDFTIRVRECCKSEFVTSEELVTGRLNEYPEFTDSRASVRGAGGSPGTITNTTMISFDSVLEVPTASGMGLLLLSALLGVGGLVLLRR